MPTADSPAKPEQHAQATSRSTIGRSPSASARCSSSSTQEVRRPRLPAERARDRRGRRAVVAVHGARAPRRAPGQGLPPPRPDASPARSRSRSSRPPARRSSAGRCGTSRSSATSPPAPACSRPSTSRRCCPLPEDFTGDGELFMLRVRGESMIDAGIFDGDYVVVRDAADRRQRRHRRRRHPRRGSDGEDVPAPARQDRAAAGQPDDGRHRLRRRRRADLRQGRHAAAPPLTPDGTAPEHTRRTRTELVALDALAGGVRELRDRRGRSCTPAMPCAANRATSVQPSFGRTPSTPRADELGDERVREVRRRRRRRAQHLDSSASPSSSSSSAIASLDRARRRDPPVHDERRTDRVRRCWRRHLDAHDLERLAVRRGRRRPRPRRVEPGAAGEHRRDAVDRVRPHPRPGGVRARARERRPDVDRALTPGFDPAAGRFEQDREVAATSSGCSANRCRRPLCSSATSSPS